MQQQATAAAAQQQQSAGLYDGGDVGFDDTQQQRGGQVRVGANGNNSKLPRYAAPTSSTTLPEFSNSESDAIRASFSTGSYRMIAHLPTELRAHHVSEATAARIDENLTSALFVAPHGSFRKLGSKGATQDALFSSFDYHPEEYNSLLASRLLRETRQAAEAARVAVNPAPFLYSTPRPMLTNALAGMPGFDESVKYSEPYASAEDEVRRQEYLRSQGLLHGPFVPSHGSRSLGDDRVMRLRLPDILQGLMRDLDADWGDVEFQIYADPEDLIIIQFTEASLDNVKGLQAYMNMFINTNSQSQQNKCACRYSQQPKCSSSVSFSFLVLSCCFLLCCRCC